MIALILRAIDKCIKTVYVFMNYVVSTAAQVIYLGSCLAFFCKSKNIISMPLPK